MRVLRSATVLALLAAAAACDDGVVRPEAAARLDSRPEGFPTPGELRNGFVLGRDGSPTNVSFAVHEGRAIFEGDIDLGPAEQIPASAEQAARGGALTPRLGVVRDGSSARWPSGRVPYVIASNLPSPSRVTDAIAHIEANTGRVDFVPRTNETDYIYVRTSTGCSSSVGRVGGVQYVNLASGCSTGNTIHELLHALGMFHEHTRCDRDSFVTINLSNVTSGYENNFTRQCTNATDYSSYAEGSIMHYGAYAFSKNGLPTIVSKRGLDSQMGQRSGMNSTDRATIDLVYP